MDVDPYNATIGAALRARRSAHGWTQAFLAERAAVSPNYVARLERGELCPSLRVAHRLCRALGATLESIVEKAA